MLILELELFLFLLQLNLLVVECLLKLFFLCVGMLLVVLGFNFDLVLTQFQFFLQVRTNQFLLI